MRKILGLFTSVWRHLGHNAVYAMITGSLGSGILLWSQTHYIAAGLILAGVVFVILCIRDWLDAKERQKAQAQLVPPITNVSPINQGGGVSAAHI